MHLVTKLRKYNNGFKTLKGIGQHYQIDSQVFKNHLSMSTRLIYAFIRSYYWSETKVANVSFKKLSSNSGYSENTVRKAIAELASNHLIYVEKKTYRNENGGITTFNSYSFPVITNYERITYNFLHFSSLDNKDKEFIIMLLPYLLPNDCIGSIQSPANHKWIMECSKEQIGKPLSRTTVQRRLKSLKSKALIQDHYSETFYMTEPIWTGYKFDMFKIMGLDPVEVETKNVNSFEELYVNNSIKPEENCTKNYRDIKLTEQPLPSTGLLKPPKISFEIPKPPVSSTDN